MGISWHIIWLVVSTILKNTSQWEGLSHILWKIKMFETTNQSCIGVWLFISAHGIPWCHKWIGQHGPWDADLTHLRPHFQIPYLRSRLVRWLQNMFGHMKKRSEMIVTKNWWWSTTKLERFYLVLSFWLSDVACELDAQRIVSADSTDQTSFNLVNVKSPVAIMDDNSKMGSVILDYPRACAHKKGV